MWVRTSKDRVALYNLEAFEVVFAEHDLKTDRWVVQAMQRDGEGRVELAEGDDQTGAENILGAIADSMLSGATLFDLGRG
jgi:hypothetical protein